MKRIQSYDNFITEGFLSNIVKTLFGRGKESKRDQKEAISSIKDKLSDKGLLTDDLVSRLDSILNHEKSDTLNFKIMDRTINNVLLKSGDKSKNINKFLNKVESSLEDRLIAPKEVPEEYMDEVEGEKSEISRKEFQKNKRILQVELLKMQEWLKKVNKSVIIVFEGRDTAGKGSTIKKFTEYLDPKFYKVIAKGIPTQEERENWFARYEKDIEPGKIIFFDRSWYNRGVVEPVMGYSTYEEYEEFMARVNDFEKKLVDDGNYLIKFWLSITKDTQAKRFDVRKGSPLKYWKFSPNDAQAQKKWDEYTRYKKRVFRVTSTDHAPWTIVDSNDKRMSGLNSMRYVLSRVPYEDKNDSVVNIEYPEAITTIKN